MKKLVFLTFILLLTGCNKYTDLESLAIIKSIGISHNEEYTIYAQIIDEITKDREVKMKVIESTDSNLEKAIQNIKNKINKELFMSHIDLLIIDHNLRNNDYQNIIDYFISSNNYRNDFLCVFSKEIQSVLENSKYDEIEKLLETNKESKNIIYKNFEEVIREYLDNKYFTLSNITYNKEIVFNGNLKYNGYLERIINEKD